MSVEQLPNYLRSHRKRTGLSQKEVAFLLSVESGSKVSRYEHFVRIPTLSTAFAFGVIFAVPLEELFAGIAEQAEQVTIRQATVLAKRLAARRDYPLLAEKLTSLTAIIEPRVEEVKYESLSQP
jgi:transcriptional regulator with XRE-family HTH domain